MTSKSSYDHITPSLPRKVDGDKKSLPRNVPRNTTQDSQETKATHASKDWWMDKCEGYIYAMEYYSSMKMKHWYISQWKKPDTKDHILCDSTHMQKLE